jgi:hypothetical protein
LKHTEPKTGAARSSFVHAVLLLIFLIVAYLGYTVLKKGDITSSLNTLVNMDVENFRPLQSMTENKKVVLQKSFGGFWVFSTDDQDAPIQKYDCLELKENGIMWEVIRWNVQFPDGAVDSYYRICHGYLNPYSVAADGKSIVCEVRTIRQIYIHGADTCFGKSQVDELWQTRKEDSLLIMNRKRYMPYHGELTEFFPEGMIDVVDKLLLKECVHEMSLTYLVKQQLSAVYQNNQTTRTCDSTVIHQNITDYFMSVYVDELFPSLAYFPSIPDSFSFPVTLNFDGSVTLGLSEGKRARAHHVEGLIIETMEHWPFPRCDSKTPVEIQHTIHLPPQ